MAFLKKIMVYFVLVYSVCQKSDTLLVSEFLPLLDALYLQFLFTYCRDTLCAFGY